MNLNYCNKCNYLIPFGELYVYKQCKHKHHIFECTSIEDVVCEEDYCSKCKQKNIKLHKLACIVKKNILKNIFPKIEKFFKKIEINKQIKETGIFTSKYYKIQEHGSIKYCYCCRKSFNNLDEIQHCILCNKCINTKYYYHSKLNNKCTHYIHTKEEKYYKRQFDEIIDEINYIPGGQYYKKAKKEFKELSKK